MLPRLACTSTSHNHLATQHLISQVKTRSDSCKRVINENSERGGPELSRGACTHGLIDHGVRCEDWDATGQYDFYVLLIEMDVHFYK
ncbi:unnamed protein product [Leptosia nina]|uniref:Uncharacterized protein n=1 Tax=Leptosia nina TaxID=320188 RepID=A0AAV1JQ06_9NEOP